MLETQLFFRQVAALVYIYSNPIVDVIQEMYYEAIAGPPSIINTAPMTAGGYQ